MPGKWAKANIKTNLRSLDFEFDFLKGDSLKDFFWGFKLLGKF